MKLQSILILVFAQTALSLSGTAQGIRAVTRPVLISPAPGPFFQWPSAPPVRNPAAQVPFSPSPSLSLPASTSPISAISPQEVARKTLEFHIKRANEGAAYAQYALGVRYLKGDGVEKDLAMAKKWLVAAAENGDKPALRKLAELEDRGQPQGKSDLPRNLIPARHSESPDQPK
ncbi:MAG: SEL1-like repeat protein [Verrucomicrobia bacterium]|nr:SEL1-like repeat protein [Verrucomicrobiota bacterium]